MLGVSRASYYYSTANKIVALAGGNAEEQIAKKKKGTKATSNTAFHELQGTIEKQVWLAMNEQREKVQNTVLGIKEVIVEVNRGITN